jgi:hypothetical protein
MRAAEADVVQTECVDGRQSCQDHQIWYASYRGPIILGIETLDHESPDKWGYPACRVVQDRQVRVWLHDELEEKMESASREPVSGGET